MRREIVPMLRRARALVAGIINCDVEECVLTPHATHGIQTILYNLNLREGDIIVRCEFSHNRCSLAACSINANT